MLGNQTTYIPTFQKEHTMNTTNRFLLIVILALTLLFASSNTAQSQTSQSTFCDGQWHLNTETLVEEMTEVILGRLYLYTNRDGERQYAGACGADLYFSCEERIQSLVEIMIYEARVKGIDPWVAAAMTWKETRFNPFVISTRGARGVVQLHPRNSRFNHIRFVHGSDSYRNACKRQLGFCQEEVISEGFSLLSDSRSRCGGDLASALTMYNTGKCTHEVNYANIILDDSNRMRGVERLLAKVRIYGTYLRRYCGGYETNRC